MVKKKDERSCWAHDEVGVKVGVGKSLMRRQSQSRLEAGGRIN